MVPLQTIANLDSVMVPDSGRLQLSEKALFCQKAMITAFSELIVKLEPTVILSDLLGSFLVASEAVRFNSRCRFRHITG